MLEVKNNSILNHQLFSLSAPVRYVLMIATLEHFKQHNSDSDINLLEIGSWCGASALAWGEGMIRYNDAKGSLTCIDIWRSYLDLEENNGDLYFDVDQMGKEDIVYNIFVQNMKTLPSSITIQHMRGSSSHILTLLGKKKFDLAYIDGDHSYLHAKKDIENTMPLVKVGGYICGDDLNVQLNDCDKNFVIDNQNKDIIIDPISGRKIHPGVTLAVAETMGVVSSYGGYWLMKRTGENSWDKIDLTGMKLVIPKFFTNAKKKEALDYYYDINLSLKE